MADKPEQSGGNGGRGRPRTRPRRPIDELESLSVMQREAVARWFDALIDGQERDLRQVAQLAMQGLDSPTLTGQAAYGRIKVSVLKDLAWQMRTGRGGPLAGQGRQRKRDKTAP